MARPDNVGTCQGTQPFESELADLHCQASAWLLRLLIVAVVFVMMGVGVNARTAFFLCCFHPGGVPLGPRRHRWSVFLRLGRCNAPEPAARRHDGPGRPARGEGVGRGPHVCRACSLRVIRKVMLMFNSSLSLRLGLMPALCGATAGPVAAYK